MKKSKHFRKDVIMARVIAAVILVVLIVLIVFVGSLFTKPSADENKDSQNTEHTQNVNPGNQDTENENIETEDTESLGTEGQNTEEQGEETDTDAETDTNVENKFYDIGSSWLNSSCSINDYCLLLGNLQNNTLGFRIAKSY